MGNVIDQEVVEMRFDNSDFEKNVRGSMSSLEKLKKSLDVSNTTKALEDLGNSSSKLNFNGLANAADTIGNKFQHVFDTIIMGGLLKIGAQAVETGEKLIKALSVDNVEAGWNKFEEKTKAVGTLVSQGFDLGLVESQVERLNWFTDETSYNLTDMIDNIGKFTAKGWGLEETSTAMEGIALWAAMSGQNASAASRAMYQLAQVSAYANKQDWNSIKTLNMDTKEFRQTATEAAKSLGILKQVGDDSFKTLNNKIFSMDELFGEGLAKGQWLTQDVLRQSFQKYSAAVDQIYEYAKEKGITASEALEELNGQVDDFGRKAFKAGQEARTWGDVVDSVKDAVSTGWMTTIEKLVGNYEEATALFTRLSNDLYDVFAESGNERNEILKTWSEFGGRHALMQGLQNIWESFLSILQTVKDTFNQLFPSKTGKELYDLTDRFRDFTEKIKLSEDQLETLHEILWALMVPLKLMSNISKVGFVLVKTVLQIVAVFIRYARESGILSDVLQGLNVILQSLATIVISVAVSFLNLIAAVGRSEVVQSVLKGIANAAVFLWTYGGAAIVKFIDALASLFSGDMNGFQSKIEGFRVKIGEFIAKLEELPVVGGMLKVFIATISHIGNAIFNTGKYIAGFIAAIVTDPVGAIQTVIAKFKELGAAISGWYNDSSLKSVVEYLKQNFSGIINVVTSFVQNITGTLSELDISQILLLTLGGGVAYAVIQLGRLFAASNNFLSGINGVFKEIKKTVKSFKKGSQFEKDILAVTKALAVLFIGIVALAQLDTDSLWMAVGAIVAVVAALGTLTLIFEHLSNKVKFKGIDNVSSLAKSILAIAASLLLVAASLAIMSMVDQNYMIDNAIALVIIIGGLATAVTLLSKYAPKLSTGMIGMLMFATSIRILVGALLSINEAIKDVNKLSYMAVALGALMISLGVAASLAEKIKFSNGLGMILFASAILILINALKKIDFNNLPQIVKDIVYVASLIGIIMSITKLVRSYTEKADSEAKKTVGKGLQLAASFAAFGAALYLVSEALETITNLDLEGNFLKIAGVLVGSLAVFALFGLISKKLKVADDLLKIAEAFALITGTMYVLIKLTDAAANINPENLDPIKGALITVAAIFAGLMIVSKFTGKASVKAITSMLASVAILMLELALLAGLTKSIGWGPMMGAAVSMGIVIGAFAVAIKQCTKMAKSTNTVAIVAMMIGIIAVVGTFAMLAAQCKDAGDVVGIIAIAAALGGVLVALGFVFKQVSNVTRSIKWEPIRAMVVAFGVIAAAMIGLTYAANGDWGTVLASGIAISGALLALAGTCKLVSTITRQSKMEPVKAMIGALVGIALSLTLLTAVGDWGTILAAGVALSGTLLAFAGSCVIVSKMAKGFDKVAIIEMIGAMVTAAASLALLVYFGQNSGSIFSAALVLSGVMAIFAVISSMVGASSIAGAASVAILAGSMVVAALSLLILANQPMEGVFTAALALVGIVTVLTIVSTLATAAIPGSVAILIMSASLIPAAASLAILAKYDMDKVYGAVGALALCMAAIALISTLAVAAAPGAAVLGVLGVSTMLFGLALAALNGLEAPVDYVTDLLAITAMLVAVGVLGALATASCLTLPVLGLSVALFALALQPLSSINTSDISDSASDLVDIASSLLVVGLLAALISTSSIIELGNSILPLVTGLLYLSKCDWNSVSRAVDVLPAFADAMEDLDDISSDSSSLAETAIAITAIGNSLIGLAVATPYFVVFTSSFNAFVNSCINSGESLTAAIDKICKSLSTLGPQMAKAMNFAFQGAHNEASNKMLVMYNDGKLWGDKFLQGFRDGLTVHSPGVEEAAAIGWAMAGAHNESKKQESVMKTDGTNLGDKFVKGFSEQLSNGDIGSSISNALGSVDLSKAEGLASEYGINLGDALGGDLKDVLTQNLGEIPSILTDGLNFGPIDTELDVNVKANINLIMGSGTRSDYEYQLKTSISSIERQMAQLDTSASSSSYKMQELSSKLKTAKDSYDSFINSNKDYAQQLGKSTKSTDDLSKALQPGLEQALGGAGKGAKKAKEDIKDLGETIRGQIDIFKEFDGKTDLTADKLIENMRSQVNGVAKWAVQMQELGSKGIDQGLLQKLADMGPQGFEYVNAFTQMTADQLKEANTLWSASLAMPDVAASMVDNGLNICKGLADGIKANKDIAVTESKQMAVDFNDGFQTEEQMHSPSKVWYQFGMYLMEGLRIGITNYMDQPKEQIRVLCAQLLLIARSKIRPSDYAEIGRYICEGLANGVSSNADRVYSEVDRLCSDIKSKIQSAMQVHSPSRFTYWIGENLDKGLADGISDNASSVFNATEDMTSLALNAMQNSIAAISEAIDADINNQPVIRPVLDLSNVRAGAQQVNSLFNSTRASVYGNSVYDDEDINNANAQGGITLNQYNYSPKALSRIDIYRQTKNQLSTLKGMVNA